jgi:hypothetical protein
MRPAPRHRSRDEGRDALRFLRDLAPAEAQHAPTRQGERRVADAIALERSWAAVERVAVDLDDETAAGPGEVRLESLDTGVDVRMRQPRSPAQLQELLFEGATGGSRPPVPLGEQLSECRHSRTTRCPGDRPLESSGVEAAQGHRPDEALLERRDAHERREVDERPLRCRHREALVARGLLRPEGAAMDAEAGAPITPSFTRDREVHDAGVVGAPVPDHGGSRVAEHRPVDGQKGGEVAPARAHETVPDGIDALVDPMQPAASDAHVDRRAAEA